METERLASSVEETHVGGGARLRPASGFDDVALVPGALTIDPEDVDLSWQLGPHRFAVPILASAMDGVVDPPFAIALGRLGGLAVLNPDALKPRYDDLPEPLAAIAEAATERALGSLQELYQPPVRQD